MHTGDSPVQLILMLQLGDIEMSEVKIPRDLKSHFIEQIERHNQRMTDYSLKFEDRRYSERAVKSFTRRLNKLNRQHKDT